METNESTEESKIERSAQPEETSQSAAVQLTESINEPMEVDAAPDALEPELPTPPVQIPSTPVVLPPNPITPATTPITPVVKHLTPKFVYTI